MDTHHPTLTVAPESQQGQALRCFPDGKLTWPVIQLCKAIGISRGHYYELELVGMGPRKLQIGRRPMITAEAAAEWLSALERHGEQVRERLRALHNERMKEASSASSA